MVNSLFNVGLSQTHQLPQLQPLRRVSSKHDAAGIELTTLQFVTVAQHLTVTAQVCGS